MDYTLIGHPKTRAFRVMWMLEELDQPYEHIGAPPQDPTVRAINPSGKIPALRVGDEVITDSVAICQYLADHHGKLTFKAGTIARAHQDSLVQFAMDDLEHPLWTHGKNAFVLPEDKRVAAIFPNCEADFNKAMKVLEIRLSDKTFAMGEAFTIADIMLVHCLNWAAGIGYSIPEGVISSYAERCRQRSAYQRAWAKRDEVSAY